ncbi:MAG: peptide-methionine (S)-S-oxide reductase MsrA [Vampirovibrionales bacterium]|nr:peptide-methionine (S)-S-oxide reductase MsrA [Vampirovibrionales bacterium]
MALTGTELATFAAGCFWGVEAKFAALPGVHRAVSGYTGGAYPDPTCETVCHQAKDDLNGHAEAVAVTFDPSVISYEQLLGVFWKLHDPTQLNRQGPDVGAQYRSAIFTHTSEQAAIASASKLALEQQLGKPVVTQIIAAGVFYEAEDYHQQYYAKKGILVPSCGL